MKKLLCLLAALLVCGALTMLVSAEETATVPTTCQACGQEVTWTAMPSSAPTTAGHYHYYLTKTATKSQFSIKTSGVTICLDLNGFGYVTTGRSMNLGSGVVLNIMDSSADKTGYIQGRRGTNNTVGGTITIAENATVNLYSGTLRCIMDDDGQLLYRAGVVYIQTGATMNVYGGVVEGGEVLDDGKNTPRGATITNNGNLNLYGGEIQMGKLPEGKGVAPCVESANGKVKLTGNAKVADLYGPAGFLTVDGTFTGNAYVTLSGTLSSGLVVGKGTNTPNVTGNLFCNNGDGWLINLSGSDLKLATFTPSATCHYCEHCKNVVKWTALTSDNVATLNTAGEYHMYLAAQRKSWAQAKIATDAKVCLDLYGNKWLAQDQRVFYLYENSQFNLMDTVGGGEVVAITCKNNPTGGLTILKTGAEFNMYGGTLRAETKYLEGYGIGVGGIAYMSESGIFNLYGGTIQGIDLVWSEYKLTAANGVGAAFFLNNSAQLNVFGGHIVNGTLADKCVGPCVYVNSGTAKVTVSGDGQVDDVYCKSENDQLTISGDFKGSVNLSYPATVTLAEGQVVGKAVNASLADATAICGDSWMLAVSGENLVLAPNATAILYSGETAQTFETLQAAVDAYESGYIKMMRPSSEATTIAKNLVLDLNGKTVSGVTVADGCTLSIQDAQTDDFDVTNGIYGKLTATGNVKGAESYLLVNEEGQLSAHKYEAAITAMTLRADAAGIYYKSSFLGDEKVAAAVETFGLALSVIDEPYEKNMATKCVASEFTGFESGENGNTAASTLLKGILKDTNTDAVNSRNLAMTIYGRPYIKTADGYFFGATVSRALDHQLTDIDGMVDTLSGAQLHAVKEFYKKFEAQLSSLNLENIAREAHDTTLKILGIGNSYTQDSMWILGAIYKAEKNQDVELAIAYEGGCPLNDHVEFYNTNNPCYSFNRYDPKVGKWVTTKNVTLKEIIEADDWDLVSMQQSSGKSGVESSYNGDIDTIQGFVTKGLGYTPTFIWNMTWSYPTDVPDDADNHWFYANYYNSDQEYMYQMITQAVQNKIVPNDTFRWIMPTGTAVQNAKSSYLPDTELYRDSTHLNDDTRLMAGYVWFCMLEGVPTESFKLNYIPDAVTRTYTESGDIYLDAEKFAVLEESVRNAIATPFTVTQSQYTEN